MNRTTVEKIEVNRGQLNFEFEWLCRKLKIRNNGIWRTAFCQRNLVCTKLL